MKNILNHLFTFNTLTKEEACKALLGIGKGYYKPAEVAAFMTAFQMRSITVDELAGFQEAMLRLCIPVDLAAYDVMDVCGTGGDGKDTFNISTLSAFVVAGAGQRVAKHGNHGVSSAVGSSTILEYLGYQFTSDYELLQYSIEKAGICFLHAPLFHPAMKQVAPIRRELGIKTFFNLLGPLVNPALPKKQLVGAYSLDVARLYGYLLQQQGGQFMVLHALDGYDEVSLTGTFKTITAHSEQLWTPEQLGLGQTKAAELAGGRSIRESAQIFMDVLNNEATTAQTEVVIANAAMALFAAGQATSVIECVDMARESLMSGRALRCFKQGMAATKPAKLLAGWSHYAATNQFAVAA